MYIPEPFAENRLGILHRLIREHNFGLLIGRVDGAPFATHLPFLLDGARGPRGTLLAHMARANPHWRSFGGDEALVVFSGPHGYVSPRWYGPGDAVPTWNYLAVHVYGVPRVMDEPDAVRDHLRVLAAAHEGHDSPWSPDDLPGDYLGAMQAGIVAFEMAITRMEGKAKLSQNRSAADRAGVAAALEETGRPGDRELAAIMAELGT